MPSQKKKLTVFAYFFDYRPVAHLLLSFLMRAEKRLVEVLITFWLLFVDNVPKIFPRKLSIG